MGKRKCGADVPSSPPSLPPPLPDLSCPSGMNAVSTEKLPRLPISTSVASTMENIPAKQSNSHVSHGHHHSNPGHAVFIKRSRHHHKLHFSRQNFAGHRSGSTSHTRSTPFADERLYFKMGSRHNSEFGYHKGKHSTERRVWREKAVFRPERIMSSSSVLSAVPSEATEMACGICGKSLEWFDVVAVLVCGHAYHAECLEQTTREMDDIRDPPCPAC